MASNAELHRKMEEALTKGDMDSVRELIAEDVVNHVPGRNPLAGVHHGRDAFLEKLQQIVDLTEGNVCSRVEEGDGTEEAARRRWRRTLP